MTNSENFAEKAPNSPEPSVCPKNGTKRFCNGFLTFCNAVELEHAAEKSGRYLIAPFGDFKKGDLVQRVDAVAARNLQRNMQSVWTKVKNAFGNACPVFYGHPDGEDSLAVPTNADKTPYGKVRSLEIANDGIYARIEWLEGFAQLPKRLQISPRWNADFIAENIARPSRLLSIGLTRNPNIKDTSFVNSEAGTPAPEFEQQTKETPMDKEILLLLGYSEEDAQKIISKAEGAPTDVFVRIKNALKDWSASQGKIEAAQTEAAEAKTALANSREALKKSQAARAKLVVANAISNGRLAEFQRSGAEKILANSEDFEKDEAEMNAAKPAVKTAAKTDGIEKTEKERLLNSQKAQAKIAELVKGKEDAGMDYAAAWDAVKAENPELFKTAYPDQR